MKEKTRITPDNVDSTTSRDSIVRLYLQTSQRVSLVLRASRNLSSCKLESIFDFIFTLLNSSFNVSTEIQHAVTYLYIENQKIQKYKMFALRLANVVQKHSKI